MSAAPGETMQDYIVRLEGKIANKHQSILQLLKIIEDQNAELAAFQPQADNFAMLMERLDMLEGKIDRLLIEFVRRTPDLHPWEPEHVREKKRRDLVKEAGA